MKLTVHSYAKGNVRDEAVDVRIFIRVKMSWRQPAPCSCRIRIDGRLATRLKALKEILEQPSLEKVIGRLVEW